MDMTLTFQLWDGVSAGDVKVHVRKLLELELHLILEDAQVLDSIRNLLGLGTLGEEPKCYKLYYIRH